MYLYNSATHKKAEFLTHTPGRVEMYTWTYRLSFCAHRKPAQLYYGGCPGKGTPL